MRAFLALCVLGIGVAGVNAATIQSPAPAGAPVLSDAGQNGDSAGGTTVTTPSQDAGTASTSPTGLPPSSTTLSDDPINWPKAAPVAVSKGGSGKGYGTRTGGRRAGGGGGHSKGGGGGHSRGAGRAVKTTSGGGGSAHRGRNGKTAKG